MADYKYIIIGAGMTGDAAAHGIRERDASGSIAMFGDESDPPYLRPPLSKGLWSGTSFDSIWLHAEGLGVDLHLGAGIIAIDRLRREVVTRRGERHRYQRLLLATGGRPRRGPWDHGDVLYFRTVDDYRRLRDLAGRVTDFVVVGGGFIGSELAAALARHGRRVTLVFPGPGIGARILPLGLSRALNGYYEERGVKVMAQARVERIEARGGRKRVGLSDGSELVADAVVAGLGIEPNDELARRAELAVDDGILVDDLLRTSGPDVFAAGDVASLIHPRPGRRARIEHEDAAVRSGRIAGLNMAGAREPYRPEPLFHSDLFELGYDAVGDLDARAETVEDWTERYVRGVVYYLRDERVSGVLLWNLPDGVAAARRLIAAVGPVAPEKLQGRIADGRGGELRA